MTRSSRHFPVIYLIGHLCYFWPIWNLFLEISLLPCLLWPSSYRVSLKVFIFCLHCLKICHYGVYWSSLSKTPLSVQTLQMASPPSYSLRPSPESSFGFELTSNHLLSYPWDGWLMTFTSRRTGSEFLSCKFPAKAIAIPFFVTIMRLQVLIVSHLQTLVEEMTAWLAHCLFPTPHIHAFHTRRIIACLASLTDREGHLGSYLPNCQKSAESLLLSGRAFIIDDEGTVGSFPILVASNTSVTC